MAAYKYRILLTSVLAVFLSGCGVSLLPTTVDTVRSPWESFEEAQSVFDKVIVYETDLEGLKKLGFDPFSTANMKILTYLDIMDRFMPNPAIKKEDLDIGIRECIEAQSDCHAYEMTVQVFNSERKGNVFLDLFGFKRKTYRSGWQFQSLFVINKGFVAYKLWGGQPHINETSLQKKPLGPLQEGGDAVVGVARAVF
ncbi:MAG: hypothetical protein KKD73_06550 [Proteobacteria bacterium]|nr:hypothetical protein [Pseudomonadota bacterium]MBU1641508.1 hypothetical protein [Pseudomonadota bacterium]